MQAFIFIGRSGCGKGTQAELLKGAISRDGESVLYIETGENFRNFIKGDSYSSSLSRAVYERGDLQPSFLAAYMWIDEMIKIFTGKEKLIFDGTPRSLDEAQIMTGAFRFYGIKKPVVVHLSVSREWSKNRLLSRGRVDDKNEAGVEKRLDWFESDVLPALNYFKDHKDYSFVEVDGEQAIEKVHGDIVSALERLYTSDK